MINYVEEPEWHEKVAELTEGRGADCVVEIGGPGTLANSIESLAIGGHISLIGSSLLRSGTMLDPLLLGGRGMTLGSISVGSRADFEAMNRALALHRLRPVIDRVFPFDQAIEAYRHFENRAHWDCRAIGGQAAAATLGSALFAAKKRCPKLAPNVPL